LIFYGLLTIKLEHLEQFFVPSLAQNALPVAAPVLIHPPVFSSLTVIPILLGFTFIQK